MTDNVITEPLAILCPTCRRVIEAIADHIARGDVVTGVRS